MERDEERMVKTERITHTHTNIQSERPIHKMSKIEIDTYEKVVALNKHRTHSVG